MVGAGELAGWDTRLGARSKFKLSAGSKRFALISTKMHRSTSLSVFLAPSLSLSLSPKRIPLFCSVLPSLSLTSFRQSQIIHFAASKCINILPVAFVALIRLSPSHSFSSSSSYRLFVAHRFGLELLVDCCDCLANLSG